MKKLLLLLLFAGLLNTGSVFGWGREGHETIAKIAERNLTKKAKKRIEKYLGGHSIVYFAKWMDEYRHTPEYKFTTNCVTRIRCSRRAATPSTDWSRPSRT